MISKIIGSYSEREVKRIRKTVKKILNLEKEMQSLDNESLSNKTNEFKDRLKNGETLEDILVEAFAVVREASWRILHLKHFEVQLVGGIVLHQGRIAEMKTGEGKTLTETCPAYLNALTGNGVHIVTVNDYLAKRDMETMKPLYDFLNITCGVVTSNSSEEDRRENYNKDITYITNNELGFDYLRDNMVFNMEDKVQRPFNFALVDEVDSILIDEARTPLIISGKGEEPTDLYRIADVFTKSLNKEDYKEDRKIRSVILTETGVEKAEKVFGIKNFSDIENQEIRHIIYQSLKANYMMKKEIDYICKNNSVIIIDEFTGRIMDGRRYSDGLHQAIEAKEGVKINPENKTLATITYQNLFRLYKKLSGMTGTAYTEEEEFRETYNLDVVVIPTNKKVIRKDLNDKIYSTNKAKTKAIIEDIVKTHKKGQPVLVGTSSIEKSEELSKLLKELNIEHKVLNAKYHEKEAEIISHAGEFGAVTIATNMAGRGTDIKLSKESIEVGGLKVIGTERADNRRIDNQLRGRSGRQGDPGESIFYLSFEDNLLSIFCSEDIIEKLEHSLKANGKSDVLLQNRFFTKRVNQAQRRVEGMHFESRKETMKYDNIVNKQRSIIYKERDKVLQGIDIIEQIKYMIENTIDNIINKEFNEYINEENIEGFSESLNNLCDYISLQLFKITDEEKKSFEDLELEDIRKKLKEKGLKLFAEKQELYDETTFYNMLKRILLKTVDAKWILYLEDIKQIKQASSLATYKQQDPLNQFSVESFDAFNRLIEEIGFETVKSVFNMACD